jgi:ferric-dicitrate binding protein FerR (iron transport regulator)
MAAGRAPAAFSCLRSVRHGEAWEALPRLERELGECSAMAAGRAPPAISWGRRLERDMGTYSRRSSAMVAGRAPTVSYLRSADE